METLMPFIVAIVCWIVIYKYNFNKRNKSKLLSHIMGFAFSFLALIITIIIVAPEVKKEQVNNEVTNQTQLIGENKNEPLSNPSISNVTFKVLTVSDYPYTLKGKPAVTFNIGLNDNNYIDITINRENIKKGFKLNTKLHPEDENLISFKGIWDGRKYFKNNNSYIIFEIFDLIPETKTAVLNVEFKLNTADTPLHSIFKQTPIYIEDKLYDNFVKNIK